LVARRGGMFAGERERGLRGVVERRAGPIRSRVAERTVLREPRGHMARIVRALVVRRVARIASSAQPLIHAARMALLTSRREVLAGERERSLRGVIEPGAGPVDRGVAQGTILRESGGGVIRIVRPLIIFQMAGIAGRAQGCILTTRMALGTGRSGVFARQRKLGGAVVKR
jgi:hypothetical protein